jgi:hypothetical protein
LPYRHPFRNGRNGIRMFRSGTHLDAGGSGLDPNVRDALETLK